MDMGAGASLQGAGHLRELRTWVSEDQGQARRQSSLLYTNPKVQDTGLTLPVAILMYHRHKMSSGGGTRVSGGLWSGAQIQKFPQKIRASGSPELRGRRGLRMKRDMKEQQVVVWPGRGHLLCGEREPDFLFWESHR